MSARFNARIWMIHPSHPDDERPSATDDGSHSTEKKTKKKVTFEADESLVSVVEIPMRECQPRLEELTPCHPGRFGGRHPAHQQLKLQSVGRDMGLVMHIRRLSGYGTPPPGRLCVRGVRQQGKRLSPREQLPQQRTVLSSGPQSVKRLFPPTATVYPEMPSSLTGVPTVRSRLPLPDADDKLSSILARYTLRDALKIKAATRDRQSECDSDAGLNDRIRVGRGKNLINLATRGLNTGVQMKISGETLSALPRVHPSPYRQQRGVRSASCRTGIRPVRSTSVDYSERNHSSVLPNKLYAWQLANRSQQTQVESPCVMQLWDTPLKAAVQPLSPKT